MPEQMALEYRTETQPMNGNGAGSYQPISSVWEGTDRDLLEAMFKFYAVIPPEPILDSTYNAGRFWKSSKRHVVSNEGRAVCQIWRSRVRSPACRAARSGQKSEAIRRGLWRNGRVREESKLEPELPVSAIFEAGQAGLKAEWPVTGKNHGYGE